LPLVLFLLLLASLPLGFAQQKTDSAYESVVAAAQDAMRRSDYKAAAEGYRQAVKMHPESAEMWANLGLMEHESGDSAAAIASFQQALRRTLLVQHREERLQRDPVRLQAVGPEVLAHQLLRRLGVGEAPGHRVARRVRVDRPREAAGDDPPATWHAVRTGMMAAGAASPTLGSAVAMAAGPLAKPTVRIWNAGETAGDEMPVTLRHIAFAAPKAGTLQMGITDGTLAAHEEHTIVITAGAPLVLTA